jgi:TolB-like protein
MGRTVLHYTVTAELGAGAMGRVYLARDERTGRRVALKFLVPAAAGDGEARARLTREATAAARLSHPNIVTLLAAEEADGELFLVQEYVEGESLAERIARGPLGPAELPRLAQALASALAHAHSHGVLHRDLKPANVLVSADGTWKVTDFGIARVEGEGTLTGTGSVVGTLAYLAPERVSGHRGDARADLFALGAVLYEAMCGRRAFAGGSEAEVLHAVMNEEPRPPEVATSSLLPLADLTMRLLAKDPAQRPPSAEAVIEALAAMQPGAPRVAPRRRGWLAPALAVLAVAVVIGAGAWLLRERLAPAPAGDAPVAVLYFDNVADPRDPGRIGSITSNLLIVSLAQTNDLNVLSTQRVLDAIRQLGHGAGTLDRGTALLVARRAHAGRIVTGSILQVTPGLVMTAEVSDVRTGRVLYAERIAGDPGQTVYELVDALGARLAGRMAKRSDAARLAPVAQRTSTDLEAQREYLAGMERFSIGDLAGADSAFTRAVARDPGFAQALYQLAITRWWGDEPESADEDIRRAQANDARLSPAEREFIGALQLLIRRDYAAAVPAFERLAARAPEDKLVLYGLEEAQFHAQRNEAAIGTARRILGLDPGFTLAGRHLVDALLRLDRQAEAQRAAEELLRRDPGSQLLWFSAINTAANREDRPALLQLRALYQRSRSRSAVPALALLAAAEGADADSVCRLLAGADAGERQLDLARQGAAYWGALHRGRFHEAKRVAMNAWKSPHAGIPWAEGFWPAAMTGDSVFGLACVDSITRYAVRTGMGFHMDDYRMPARAQFWITLGRPERARQEYERNARQAAPGTISEGIWNGVRAGLLDAEGRPGEALAWLARSRWLGFPMMASQRSLFRARLLAHCGRHAEALATLDSLVRCPAIYPDEAVRLHLDRGRSLEALGRTPEAAVEYREFLRIWKDADPGRPEVAEAQRALTRLGRGREPMATRRR